jgi:hypothetical protein
MKFPARPGSRPTHCIVNYWNCGARSLLCLSPLLRLFTNRYLSPQWLFRRSRRRLSFPKNPPKHPLSQLRYSQLSRGQLRPRLGQSRFFVRGAVRSTRGEPAIVHLLNLLRRQLRGRNRNLHMFRQVRAEWRLLCAPRFRWKRKRQFRRSLAREWLPLHRMSRRLRLERSH